jgi:transposase
MNVLTPQRTEIRDMGHNFLPYEQRQNYLLPPSIIDWVRPESLECFVSELIDQLGDKGRLEVFFVGYREDGWGRAAYHPRMMVKVLVYSYCKGITSSRKIAQAIEGEVAFRYLAANQQPDFRTISDFRKNRLVALQGLFVEVLRLCQEAGLAKMGRVALDGRKVAGNAALDQNRNKEALEAEAKRILEEADRVDAEEDEKYGKDKRGDELPEELRDPRSRAQRIAEAYARLEEAERREKEKQEKKLEEREREEEETGKKKRGRKPKDPEEVVDKEKKANITDPDSRILKTRRGWVQGYNAQAVADCETQVIVAEDVTQEENDVKQLEPMLLRCEEQAGERPKEMLADAGYWSEENAKLEDDQTELFISTTKEWKQRKAQREKGTPRGPIPRDATLNDRMERKLLIRRGRNAYRERGSTIEPVFGQMVMRGLTRFVLRGYTKVKGEWSLWCTTHNLLKLWRSGYVPNPACG